MTTIEDVTINGDGSQNVFGNTVDRDLIITQLNFVRSRPSMVLSEGEIDERVREYVPALNHAQIVQTLRDFRVVALAGPVGAGVTTTAIAALRELQPTLPVRLFATEDDDMEEIGATNVHGYLVRAGGEQEASRLRSCYERVFRSGGFLLVVGTEVEQQRFADFLPVLRVQPPSAEAVYRHRLNCRGLGATRWLHWPRAAELLRGASPGDARRLADIIQLAHREGRDEHEAEQAYQGWAEYLRDWFIKHPELLDQALLIAAVTISPADETSVYSAALSLARQLRITLEGGGLAWRPSTELDELLGADRAGDRLVFRRQGFAPSVLRHICVEYPLIRMDLLSWLSALPTDTVVALEPALRRKIVEAFADLASDYDAPEKIIQMAASWADGRQRTADLAYVALARSCLHTLVGGRIRRKLYEWSRERQAPLTLKLTVARVCEVLGQAYLPLALTRLKHLATDGDQEVQKEVLDVARSLAKINPVVVFETALTWCQNAADRPGEPTTRRLGVALRLLVDIVPDVGPAGLQSLLAVIQYLAGQNTQIHPALLEGARALAVPYRAAVLDAALIWSESSPFAGTNSAPTAWMGTQLFLSLAADRDRAALSVILTGADGIAPVDPTACTRPWSMAVSMETVRHGTFAQFGNAMALWLETATIRPDLRAGIVSSLVAAVGTDIERQFIVGVVRQWAGESAQRRGVMEDILVKVLRPHWQRMLLILSIRMRSVIAGGGSRGR